MLLSPQETLALRAFMDGATEADIVATIERVNLWLGEGDDLIEIPDDLVPVIDRMICARDMILVGRIKALETKLVTAERNYQQMRDQRDGALLVIDAVRSAVSEK